MDEIYSCDTSFCCSVSTLLLLSELNHESAEFSENVHDHEGVIEESQWAKESFREDVKW